MSNIDVKELRKLAANATPGKWWIDSHGEALVAFTDDGMKTVLKPEHLREKAHRDENTGSLSYWPNDSDASWIAAAQPNNIIPLLDQLEALTAENAVIRIAIDQTIGWQESTDPKNTESTRLLTAIKTPATDAAIAEIESVGAEKMFNLVEPAVRNFCNPVTARLVLEELAILATDLRAGRKG
jgi:hypothetical protein